MRATMFPLRSFGPSTFTSAAGNPASSSRLAIAFAAVVVLPTESVVLMSISSSRMSRERRRVASSSPAAISTQTERNNASFRVMDIGPSYVILFSYETPSSGVRPRRVRAGAGHGGPVHHCPHPQRRAGAFADYAHAPPAYRPLRPARHRLAQSRSGGQMGRLAAHAVGAEERPPRVLGFRPPRLDQRTRLRLHHRAGPAESQVRSAGVDAVYKRCHFGFRYRDRSAA